MATLIFPAVNRPALAYRDEAAQRGEAIVAASSVYDAGMESAFGHLVVLPYVYDSAFHDAFSQLLASRDIDRVYAPVASVHAFLQVYFAREGLPVKLVGASPIAVQVAAYRELLARAAALRPSAAACSSRPADVPSVLEIAAILKHAEDIYGESNDEKLVAIAGIFPEVPKGDVIEIGSLMGRSAFVLQYLARRYDTGAVLSVDPLAPEASFQHDIPGDVQSTMDDQWDYDVLRRAFVVNTLPTAAGRFNYLRATSADGVRIYESTRTVRTPEFGEVHYEGTIAVIHIDGNHDYAHVKEDCDLWLPALRPGGWLVLDDYVWAHGDGPYRVGNALLESRGKEIRRAFLCGKALFVQFT
ncbi:MAG: class I SAM-dependent methyltransferase [Candidatus Eremiobacteraeota bacterium]|nr:class I SAM-dependent methyltransferase [Candidatus Eremiobacteraeota bacterium]MBV8283923.1 class I SAM-dependent methyltransferase [Candidatus Eremiobacteraeota bacterium]MBV8655793.1 class I SAM-dependent methyltransferase [Candidatus Eremiobacteraeota bacterium]